ncbi:MAG: 2-amino-4-hydroxy-6-hydroxymethyldihydropteridine diphosphokinase [Bacteroidales bacterium]|nr:2-amino-4-hydroxy-6-hydroxymethyldihydropteridine diphosphokinase [Bacteroidales bacterium]
MAKLYLALGSNIGARKANIMSALSFLNGILGRYEALSDLVTTEACGFEGPPFLNCVVRYSSRKTPASILAICKDIERRMGRTEQPQYTPDGARIYHNRIIDIDILMYGKVQINTPELTIPHPQVESRPFVRPLLEQVMKND